MNRINQLLQRKGKNVLSIFLTAGYPELNDTKSTVFELEQSGVDLIEIGMPFSDPLADGETIQKSSQQALKNGMNLNVLFHQLTEIRNQSELPIVLMGYLNPILKFGLIPFLEKCSEIGVDGLIIPDISIEEYEYQFQAQFELFNIPLIFLASPKTSDERLKKIKKHTKTFIYYVSSASTTGKTQPEFNSDDLRVFEDFRKKIGEVPVLCGFGIHNQKTLQQVFQYFNGAIIGSAFIRAQEKEQVQEFLNGLKFKALV